MLENRVPKTSQACSQFFDFRATKQSNVEFKVRELSTTTDLPKLFLIPESNADITFLAKKIQTTLKAERRLSAYRTTLAAVYRSKANKLKKKDDPKPIQMLSRMQRKIKNAKMMVSYGVASQADLSRKARISLTLAKRLLTENKIGLSMPQHQPT